MRKIITCIVAASLISGCATSTLKVDDASKLSNLTPDEFFQKRFVEDEKSPVFDVLNSALDSYINAFDGTRDRASQARVDQDRAIEEFDKKTTGLMPDKRTIIFKSLYTGMNHTQLLRPSKEAQLYCSATNGKLVTMKSETENFPIRFFSSPSRAFAEAMSRTYSGSIGYSVAGVTVMQDLNSMKGYIAEHDAEIVARRNQLLDRDGAVNGYQAAADSGAFGLFECQHEGVIKNWRVAVLPFAYKYPDPTNKLVPHELKIMIVPEVSI